MGVDFGCGDFVNGGFVMGLYGRELVCFFFRGLIFIEVFLDGVYVFVFFVFVGYGIKMFFFRYFYFIRVFFFV